MPKTRANSIGLWDSFSFDFSICGYVLVRVHALSMYPPSWALDYVSWCPLNMEHCPCLRAWSGFRVERQPPAVHYADLGLGLIHPTTFRRFQNHKKEKKSSITCLTKSLWKYISMESQGCSQQKPIWHKFFLMVKLCKRFVLVSEEVGRMRVNVTNPVAPTPPKATVKIGRRLRRGGH